ncbi:CPBP family intramembrane glutamic endopeptidase [Compostibacillus humi]|uniref:CPBP family intramembrane glutamic endopeptidase n=1 Tax=Compostibacillus humi TaxID=1245525 RepID=UPI0027E5136F|nr:CPBP family intramembrane glutamic endopeptidase [Compostibacillus humi]
MKILKQSEIAKQLSDKELRTQVWLSQCLLFAISIILSFFFFDSITAWMDLFKWNIKEILYYGLMPGIAIVLIDIVLMKYVSREKIDDGGINEKIFKNVSIPYIFFLAIFIALAEEMLFRGVIQSVFGFAAASILFAIVHFRYLTKPVLFASVIIVSFIIGYLFVLTNNLLVTITAHFVVDFLLGLYIHFQGGGKTNECKR